jgi:putative flippase GtrA
MRLNQQPLRFLVVTVCGLIVDLGIAVFLAAAGLPRPVASAGGLVVAAAFNFMLHRAWTFQTQQARPLSSQLIGYLVGLGLTLVVRVGTLTGLSLVIPTLNDLAALTLAIGTSFVFNFLFLKKLVFRERASP